METCPLFQNRIRFTQSILVNIMNILNIFHRIMHQDETTLIRQRKEWLKPHRMFLDEIAKQIKDLKKICQDTIDDSIKKLNEQIKKLMSCFSFEALLKLEQKIQNIEHLSPQSIVYTVQQYFNDLHRQITEKQKVWQVQVSQILKYFEQWSIKQVDSPIIDLQTQPSSQLEIASENYNRQYVEDLFSKFQSLKAIGGEPIIPFSITTNESKQSIQINYEEPKHLVDSDSPICSTLKFLLDKGYIKDECCAMDVLTKVCLAVQQLHDHKIYLGNISASNIFVTLTHDTLTHVQLGLPFINKDIRGMNCDRFIELLNVDTYSYGKLLVNVYPTKFQDINSLIDITQQVMQYRNSWANSVYQLYNRKEKNPILKSIYQQFTTKADVQTVDDLLNVIHRQRYPKFYQEEQISQDIQQTHPLFCNTHGLKLKYLVERKEQCYLCIIKNLQAQQSIQGS